MKVARLLIYEGSQEQLAEQLGRSMNEGVRSAHKGMTITCINLSPMFLQLCEEMGQKAIEQAYLQGDHAPKPMGEP